MYHLTLENPLTSIPMDPRHCIMMFGWGGTTVLLHVLLKSIDIFICFYKYFVLSVSNSI